MNRLLANVRALRAGSDLGRALVDSLDAADLAALAERVAPLLRAASQPEDGWLDSAGAAAYLGMSRNALHKLTAARTIPFEQDQPGGKLWFKRSALDQWRGA